MTTTTPLFGSTLPSSALQSSANDPACELVSKLANPVLKPDNLVLKPEIHIGSILV